MTSGTVYDAGPFQEIIGISFPSLELTCRITSLDEGSGVELSFLYTIGSGKWFDSGAGKYVHHVEPHPIEFWQGRFQGAQSGEIMDMREISFSPSAGYGLGGLIPSVGWDLITVQEADPPDPAECDRSYPASFFGTWHQSSGSVQPQSARPSNNFYGYAYSATGFPEFGPGYYRIAQAAFAEFFLNPAHARGNCFSASIPGNQTAPSYPGWIHEESVTRLPDEEE